MKFKASKYGPMNPSVIRLANGESVYGVLRGEPHEYKKAFNEGDKPGFRFRLNLITKVNGTLEAKILEGGFKLYQQLRELSESGWNLEEVYTKVSRQGSGKQDTVYTANVLPNKPDAATLSAVSKVQLKDLVSDLVGKVPDSNSVTNYPEPGSDMHDDGFGPA